MTVPTPDPPPRGVLEPTESFRERTRTFWRGASSTSALASAMTSVLEDFNVLLGTRAVAVWLHDRRARELWRLASSESSTDAARVAVGDTEHPAARGLRLEHPEILPDAGGHTLIAPLRGLRRALGTLVIDGQASDVPPDERLRLAADIGRQLSTGIENVQLLEEMLRQRRLLEDTFNSLTDLVIVTDSGNRVVQMNDAVKTRLGESHPAVHECQLAEIIGVELAEWASAPDTESAERVRTVDHDVFAGRLVVRVTPLINEDGESVGRVLVARDVTEQARLEAEQERLRAKLAQSEKLASLGQFVAGIAHEINNPLQGVLGHLELLMVAPRGAEEIPRPVKRELRRIYREAERAAKIVQNLLMFSGPQRIDRRAVRMGRLLQRAIASRRTALTRARIELTRHQWDERATILGDATLLHQAIVNVLVNAEQAIAESGQPGSIAIDMTQTSDRVVTTIRDSGPGIPTDVLPRIFDPFYTTKSVGQGTGLGLAITYGIIQEHGGQIQVERAPQGGTIVVIDLPVIDPSLRAEAATK